MATRNAFARIVGSTLAGAVGFAVGFYSGFFLILSVWGLEAGTLAFVFIAGTLGVVGASAAIAVTVSSERRWLALGTTAALGLVLLLATFALNADAGAMAIGALALVVVSAVLVRTGSMDSVGT